MAGRAASRSEVLPLTSAQGDLAGSVVRLEPGTTKNNEGRSFPLIPSCGASSSAGRNIPGGANVPQGRIIPQGFHRYGRPISSVRRVWMTACRKSGVPGLLLHDLRRSAVRNLERAGAFRSVAMKPTGYTTENVCRRYAIVAENDLREAGIKLATLEDSVRSVTLSGTPGRWHSLSGWKNGGLGRN